MQRMILFWRQLVAMASRSAHPSIHRACDVHHWFYIHDIDKWQKSEGNSRTIVDLSCSNGRDRLTYPGNMSSDVKHIVAG